MYMLPPILLYSIPVSILADVSIRRMNGLLRAGAALGIHLVFAAFFVFMLFSVFGEGWEPVNFVFVNALLSSFLFWAVDEGLKSAKAKQFCQKIDELKNY